MTAPTRDQIAGGDRAALARAITLAERGDTSVDPLLALARAQSGGAFRVGITGPPGAGKSSLVREIVRRLSTGNRRIGVIASDPVSPVSGGALLGDRYRMAGLSDAPGVFFRSMAHRGDTGELGLAVWKAADLLALSGVDWILLETVGTGQSDVHALRGADVRVLVHAPEGGDEIQMMKAGISETADLHVVGKCDRAGARAWAAELAAVLGAGDVSSAPPVLPVSASTGEGVDELVERLKELRARAGQHGARSETREGNQT